MDYNKEIKKTIKETNQEPKLLEISKWNGIKRFKQGIIMLLSQLLILMVGGIICLIVGAATKFNMYQIRIAFYVFLSISIFLLILSIVFIIFGAVVWKNCKEK